MDVSLSELPEFTQTHIHRVGDGQGGLVCCDSWGCKESDTTERLNNNNHTVTLSINCEGEIKAVLDMQCSLMVYSSATVRLDQRGCQHRQSHA